jgi:NAD(P)-dependent dehydrogenase (short-subunit alcohol dehydrogenase family)
MLFNKRILVLGAGGLLGKVVVDALLVNNAAVIATDIQTESLFTHFTADYAGKLEITSLDVNNEANVVSFFNDQQRIDGVVNCS